MEEILKTINIRHRHLLKLTRRCLKQATFNRKNLRNLENKNSKNDHSYSKIIDNVLKLPSKSNHHSIDLWLFYFLFFLQFSSILTKSSSNHQLFFINNYQSTNLESSLNRLSNNIKFDYLTQDRSNLQNNLPNSKFDRIGLQFILEPPSNVYIPNNSGLTIQCQASGQPSPRINWVKADNSELESVGKLRKISSDGSLIFTKFSPSEFRPDVHNAAYKCIASNSVGRISSRTVRVKANIQQPYEIQVYDDFVMRANIGVLRCHIPAFVRDYVYFVNWIRNDGLILSPEQQQDNRYMIFPSGELHISQVDQMDSQLQYRCQTRNKLTGESKQSTNSGRLIITDPHSNVPPKITDRKPFIVVDKGDQVILPCASQGSPVPITNWFQIVQQSQTTNLSTSSLSSSNLQSTNLQLSQNNYQQDHNRIKIGIDSSKDRIYQWNANLVIRDVALEDSGKYLCVVSNSVGEDSVETDLLVREPLSARIEPRLIVSQENEQLVINCTVQGYPIKKITWLKNAQLLTSTTRIRPFVDRLLFKQIKREDRGIYQCIVHNEFTESTASVELALSDEPARLIETFSSDSLLLKQGDKLSLKCVATGTPLPQITWVLDGNPIAEQHRLRVGDYVNSDGFVNSFVNISSLKLEDGGLYECVASNSALNLSPVKPYLNLWPYEDEAQQQQIKHISSTNLDSFNLPIYNQQSNDIIARHRARVNVIGPPSVRKMNNITVVSGDTLFLNCPFTGYPISKILWYKSNIKLPENHRQHVYSNGTLVIHNVDKTNDEDEYRCVVYGASSITNHYETILISANDQHLHNQHFDYHKLSASGSVFVRVIVAPLISPFLAPPSLKEGMRNILTCSVLEGDGPFQIRWYKSYESNGIIHHMIPIESSLNNINQPENQQNSRLKVTSNNEFSSTLFFSNVSYEDNANYTCIISNSVASANHTVNMMVKVAPKWVQIPHDTEAVVGQDLLIPCQASGFPAVRTWWEFQSASNQETAANQQLIKSTINNSPNYINLNTKNQSPTINTKSSYQNVISNSHIHTLENGTLIIREVSKSDEGTYLCQATNGVGGGISRVITLNVHVPAHFKNSFSAETIRKGDNVKIRCEAFGESPLTISWSKDRIPFQPSKESRYNLIEQTTGQTSGINEKQQQQLSSKEESASINRLNSLNRLNALQTLKHTHSFINILEINQTNRSDSALFTCVASNLYGKDEYNVQIILQEPPDKPENVQTSQVNSRSAIITWTVPYSGNSIIISYQAQVKKTKEVWSDINENHQIESSNGNVNVLTLRKLKPVTSYDVRLRCENALGWSEYSDVLQFVTKEEAPNRPPTGVHVYPLNSRQLQVTFKPAEQEESDTISIIKGYYVGYRLIGPQTSQINNNNQNSITLNSQSVNNLPKQDQIYTFKTVNLNELNNDNEKPFEVKLTDLKRASKYAIIVQAFNNKGSGPSTEEIFGETLLNDPPSSPILSIGTVTHNSIQLRWTFANSEFNEQLRKAIELEQANLDGIEEGVEQINQQQQTKSNQQQLNQQLQLNQTTRSTNSELLNTLKPNRESLISGYYLHYKSHKSDWEEKKLPGSTLNSFTFSNLLCGSYYQFYMIAYNSVDKSDPSKVIAARTKGSEPKPPSIKEFIQCNSTMAILQMKQWKTNGCEIHSFTVQYRLLRKPPTRTQQTELINKDGQLLANKRVDTSQSIDDWILISNNILADGRNVEIFELQPANWYSLLIGAQTDMGLSEKEYTFSTLTLDGATIAPFSTEATELSQNRLKYASYSLMFPSLCAFFVLILIIIISFFTIWRKDIQMNTNGQLNSVAALASAQHLNHLNSLSTYATPATTLHHQASVSSNTCNHFADELREQQNCTDEHLLTDACFQLSSTNACGGVLNNYTLNTFAPVYDQTAIQNAHLDAVDQFNKEHQFKEITNCNTLNNLNTINKECHQDCHLHLPTPYASNQLDYDCVLKHTNSITNQLASNLNVNNSTLCNQHTYTVQPITANNLNQQQQPAAANFTFDRYNNCSTNGTNNSEHQYDIPIPKLTPKWV